MKRHEQTVAQTHGGKEEADVGAAARVVFVVGGHATRPEPRPQTRERE